MGRESLPRDSGREPVAGLPACTQSARPRPGLPHRTFPQPGGERGKRMMLLLSGLVPAVLPGDTMGEHGVNGVCGVCRLSTRPWPSPMRIGAV